MALEDLYKLHLAANKGITLDFRRYLYAQIQWDARLIAIIGPRGVGKTTLLFQYYQDNFESPDQCLYISADNIRVIHEGLFEIASEFFQDGGQVLIIDEIHKYPNWSQELKNVYDSFPQGRVIVSGSSTLDILKGRADLSRRAVIYPLKGLSFREYLNLEAKAGLSAYPLKKILKDHVKVAAGLFESLPVLKHFKNYLNYGYYPFYLEGKDLYHSRLENVLEKILYEDIPSVFNLKTSSIPTLKNFIYLVATSQPFIPNVEKISSQLKISKEYAYCYMDYLQQAQVFAFLYPYKQGLKLVRKPAKIYLENPNLFPAIVAKGGFKSEIGAVREAFVMNQLRPLYKVHSSPHADFLVDGKFTFEVGGKQKGAKQIKGVKDAYVLADNLEIGAQRKIPLWLMGFLY